MARTSYNSVYSDILLGFINQSKGRHIRRDVQALLTLWYVGTCCDHVNECFPGVEDISDKIGYARESVIAKLQMLVDQDLMRMELVYDRRTKQYRHLFQLSPDVRYVVDEHLQAAWELYKSKPKKADVTKFFTKESYLTPESNSRPKTRPNLRPKNTTTSTAKNAQKSITPSPDLDTNEREGLDKTNASDDDQRKAPNPAQSARSNQRNAPSQKTPPVPPRPPRRLPALAECRQPIADPDSEAFAQRLTELKTRITQARQLVKAYKRSEIEAALIWLREEERRRPVERPFGLLRWWLENEAILEDDKPIDPFEQDGKRYISGEYADFIHHS